MSNHPTTIAGESADTSEIQWDDHASLHLANDGDGIFDGFKSLRGGTLAELVAQVMAFPADERARYVIEKSGDHKLGIREIEALASRSDFPHG